MQQSMKLVSEVNVSRRGIKSPDGVTFRLISNFNRVRTDSVNLINYSYFGFKESTLETFARAASL